MFRDGCTGLLKSNVSAYERRRLAALVTRRADHAVAGNQMRCTNDTIEVHQPSFAVAGFEAADNVTPGRECRDQRLSRTRSAWPEVHA